MPPQRAHGAVVTVPQTVLRDDALYLGDNGACTCGLHAGATARYTGRDLSGQRVMAIGPEERAEFERYGIEPRCEARGCNAAWRRPRRKETA